MKRSRNYLILFVFVFATGILFGSVVILFWHNPVNNELTVIPQNETTQRTNTVSGLSSVHVEIADLRREVSLLSQHLVSLETQVTRRAMEQSSIPSISNDEEPQLSAEDEKELIQKAKAQQQERLQLINHSFHSEKKDPAWSKQAASTINNAIGRWSNSKNRSEYELKQAECRSSLCRVEINFQDGKAMANFQDMFHRNIGASLPGMTMSTNQNADGTVTGVAYLTRPGVSFPE